MIIPSIDLMNGKAVQLRQGKDLVLTDERDPIELARYFNRFGEVAVIDLDAALGQGDNFELIQQLCQVADVRVGGGIRDIDKAKTLLRAGAKQLIIGTAATEDFLKQLPKNKVLVAIDHKHGQVVDKGWTNNTGESVLERAKRLAPYCAGFLCTFVAQEGTLEGVPLDDVKQFQSELKDSRLTIAGGVANTEEAANLCQLGVDVQVGMALYTGKLDLAEVVTQQVDFNKTPLIPTIVQDTAKNVLMLAYSSPESLTMALNKGTGVYYSRSRQQLWEKGLTSGHVQKLVKCRLDCDRDTLLFTVEQQDAACHNNTYTCFEDGEGVKPFSAEKLFEILNDRKENPPAGSFTAKLFSDPEFLKSKVLEEAQEVVDADNQKDLIWEIADNYFFLCATAVAAGISWQQIISELEGRHK